MGWLALALVAAFCAATLIVGTVWSLSRGELGWSALILRPIALAFWCWVGVAAWRRARRP